MAQTGDRPFLDNAVVSRLSRLNVSAQHPMLGSVSGLHRSAARGSSVEFAEYRKYVPGDDIKNLDWRVYARTDRFYIKEFEADTNLRCVLALDASASMNFAGEHGSKFDYARRMICAMAHLLVRQGDAVGLHAFNDKAILELSPRRNPSHLSTLYDQVEGLEAKGPTQLVDILHRMAENINNRAMVVVFSDLFTDVDELLDGFQHMRFRKHDLVVFHLLDRQEIQFDFDRPIRFVDMETGQGMITDPSTVRNGYQDALKTYLDAMQKGCREFGVDYHRVITDVEYERVLSAFMLQRINARASKR